MEDRNKKFKKFIEQLPRLCSPTICGTLSQPTTKAEISRTEQFEWSLEQRAILSPANITMATCSDLAFNDYDHSFLQQESDKFFSQKTIAPSPMTTPSVRNQLVRNAYDDLDEDDSDTDIEAHGKDESNCGCTDDSSADDDGDDDDDDAEQSDATRDYNHDDMMDEDDELSRSSGSSSSNEIDERDGDDEDNINEGGDDAYNDESMRDEGRDLDNLFLSPPLRSSQTQQRVDIFSPGSFEQVMEDDTTLQSTPKIYGSQIFRSRTRRGSEMSE